MPKELTTNQAIDKMGAIDMILFFSSQDTFYPLSLCLLLWQKQK